MKKLDLLEGARVGDAHRGVIGEDAQPIEVGLAEHPFQCARSDAMLGHQRIHQAEGVDLNGQFLDAGVNNGGIHEGRAGISRRFDQGADGNLNFSEDKRLKWHLENLSVTFGR